MVEDHAENQRVAKHDEGGGASLESEEHGEAGENLDGGGAAEHERDERRPGDVAAGDVLHVSPPVEDLGHSCLKKDGRDQNSGEKRKKAARKFLVPGFWFRE